MVSGAEPSGARRKGWTRGIAQEQPEVILVPGDTTTAFCGNAGAVARARTHCLR